jgi:MFS family permease
VNDSSAKPGWAAWRNVALLTGAQALFQTASILLVTVSGLIALGLAPDRALATLPMSAMIVTGAVVMVPASFLMQRWGRQKGFLLGSACGVAAGALGVVSLWRQDFALFVAANGLIGAWQGFAQYQRFAAAESAPAGQQSRAISWVMVGGVVAALAGPALARYTRELGPVGGVTYGPSFVAVMALALLAAGLVAALRGEILQQAEVGPAPGGAVAASRPLAAIVAQPLFLAALTSSSVAFSVMVMVMTATPLAMAGCSLPLSASALVIQAHVLGMFLPSFVTGSLIQRVGVLPVMGLGMALMAAHVAVALSGVALWHFTTGLVLVGVGWNLMFIGASTLVTQTYAPSERAKSQAAHDVLMSACAGVASLSAGALLQHWGWRGLNEAALAVLALAAVVLAWLSWRQRQAQALTVAA